MQDGGVRHIGFTIITSLITAILTRLGGVGDISFENRSDISEMASNQIQDGRGSVEWRPPSWILFSSSNLVRMKVFQSTIILYITKINSNWIQDGSGRHIEIQSIPFYFDKVFWTILQSNCIFMFSKMKDDDACSSHMQILHHLVKQNTLTNVNLTSSFYLLY